LKRDILLKIFNCFPTFFTEKRSIIIPIVKPGDEESKEVTKYRPISLLNVGGKVLEKLLINGINHHVFSNSLLNEKQYGFLPQKSTIDTAVAVKGFVQENLQQKNCVILVSLDVGGGGI